MIKENSFILNNIETNCSFHQLAPYIGKLRSDLVRDLILSYTKPYDTILDPFAGAGTVALESLILGRNAIANDINPYAVTLIKAKMFPPESLEIAIDKANYYLDYSKIGNENISLSDIPDWVKQFFHPETLAEITILFKILRKNEEYFLLACLLGILHHQRSGFLSYPSSHLVPYLRTKKFPKEEFSDLYCYREVGPRLINKIKRTYKRFSPIDSKLSKLCFQQDATCLKIPDFSISSVITSPPYMNTLDYGRDNRLRLWFLGVDDYRYYDKKNPTTIQGFRNLMINTMNNLKSCIKDGSYLVFILGDVKTSNKSINTSSILEDILINEVGDFNFVTMMEDEIPNNRRARRSASGTKKEWITVFQKGN